ncbi:MAG: hypothetical protein ACP5U1_09755 [Desulfomonilaceae bacterium]
MPGITIATQPSYQILHEVLNSWATRFLAVLASIFPDLANYYPIAQNALSEISINQAPFYGKRWLDRVIHSVRHLGTDFACH